MGIIHFNGNTLEIRTLADGIFRIRQTGKDEFYESLLSRYKIINDPENDIESAEYNDEIYCIQADNHSAKFNPENSVLSFKESGYTLNIKLPMLSYKSEGFHLEIKLDDTERIYGLGDVNRDKLNKRGIKTSIWVANVVSYSPIPYIMSSNGWGILVNNTYRQEYDIGVEDKNTISIDVEKGGLDIYIFLADNMIDTIRLYTDISGKPIMLPKAAYGFTSVSNESVNARELLYEALMYRREDIPCDILGLEPKWMETFYDFSLDKKWDIKGSWMPTYTAQEYTGASSVFYNLRKMGFKFSLWLCCDYDLLWEEEHSSLYIERNSFEGAAFEDKHFGYNTLMDKIMKPGEPWFEHLKKFVDNGAYAFKLDGANQVLEHPDRLWAMKYRDEEVHNVYPVIYAKQMKEGFEDYTGRRAMIYTPSAFVGTQKYAATWAGDTGGGPKTLVATMNMAMCGHTNVSCDMGRFPTSLHYAFLMPWSQANQWQSWSYPWFLGDENEDIFRRYAKLRSALFPYIYSMSHKAASTGLAIVRPLCLMYPTEEELLDVNNMYMFGDSFLVGAFDMNLRLPDGKWLDLLTKEEYVGGKAFEYDIPKGWGGAIFAKAGSVWIMQDPKPYIDSPDTPNYTICVYPGDNADFNMIEDDGVTYRYKSGEYAKTHISIRESKENSFVLCVDKRVGGYERAVDEEYDIVDMCENDIRNIKPLPDVTRFNVEVYGVGSVSEVICGEKKVTYSHENNILRFAISKEEHENADLKFAIKY